MYGHQWPECHQSQRSIDCIFYLVCNFQSAQVLFCILQSCEVSGLFVSCLQDLLIRAEVGEPGPQSPPCWALPSVHSSGCHMVGKLVTGGSQEGLSAGNCLSSPEYPTLILLPEWQHFWSQTSNVLEIKELRGCSSLLQYSGLHLQYQN